MIFRNLDVNGDWTFGSGGNNYAVANQAIGLNIQTRILSWVGDCFFALTAGIDWSNRLGSKGQKALLELDLRRSILQAENVTGLNEVSVTQVGRDFSISFDVQTIYSKSYQAIVSVGL